MNNRKLKYLLVVDLEFNFKSFLMMNMVKKLKNNILLPIIESYIKKISKIKI